MALFCKHQSSLEMDEPMEESSDSENASSPLDNLSSMQIKCAEMNALIMDYLVHEGFKEAAERFKEEANIEFDAANYSDDWYLRPTTSSSSVNAGSQVETSIIGKEQHSTSTNSDITNADKSDMHHLQTDSNNLTSLGPSSSISSSAPAPTTSKTTVSVPAASTTTQSNNSTSSAAAASNRKKNFDTPDIIDRRIEIREVIQDGDILKAKTLINTYYPELLDNNRELYFKLQQQHVIELIRNQKINEVLTYIHEELSVSDFVPLNEIERTLALLAYDNPYLSPYRDLLEQSHRLRLASETNEIILKETTGSVDTPKPRLVTLLKLVYWTQSELRRKDIKFPKMNDLFADSEFEEKP